MKAYRSRSRQSLVCSAKVWRLQLRVVNLFLPLAYQLERYWRSEAIKDPRGNKLPFLAVRRKPSGWAPRSTEPEGLRAGALLGPHRPRVGGAVTES